MARKLIPNNLDVQRPVAVRRARAVGLRRPPDVLQLPEPEPQLLHEPADVRALPAQLQGGKRNNDGNYGYAGNQFSGNVVFTFFTGYFQDRLAPRVSVLYAPLESQGAIITGLSYRWNDAFITSIGLHELLRSRVRRSRARTSRSRSTARPRTTTSAVLPRRRAGHQPRSGGGPLPLHVVGSTRSRPGNGGLPGRDKEEPLGASREALLSGLAGPGRAKSRHPLFARLRLAARSASLRLRLRSACVLCYAAARMALRIAVLLSGAGTTLENLVEQRAKGRLDVEFTAVVSSKPAAFGLERARRHGIPAHVVARAAHPDERAFNDALHAVLAEDPPEPARAGRLPLASIELRGYNGRAMNTHPSLIPAFCGPRLLRRARAPRGARVRREGDRRDDPLLRRAVRLGPDHPAARDRRARGRHARSRSRARVAEVERELYPQAIQLHAQGRLRDRGPARQDPPLADTRASARSSHQVAF